MRKTWVLITVGVIAVVGVIVIALGSAGPSADGWVAAPKPQPQSLGLEAAASKAQTRARQHEATPTPESDPGMGTGTETELLLRYHFAQHETFTVRLQSTVELTRLPPNETRPRAADGDPTAASVLADQSEQTLWELDHRVVQVYPNGSAGLEVTFRRLRSSVRVRKRTGDGHIETRYDSAAQ